MSNFEDTLNPEDRLNSFAYYFVYKFEHVLRYLLQILENRQIQQDEINIYQQILGGLAAIIPHVGKLLQKSVEKCGNYMQLSKDKKHSKILAQLIVNYSKEENKVRDMLIKSALDIFCCFEWQFKMLICDEGPTKAMQKLAEDACDRIFTYLKKENQSKVICKDDITKGVIFGTSNWNWKLNRGRTVKNDKEEKWNTSEMYTKVGWIIEHRFYKNKETKTEKYGHRRLFPWENLEDSWLEDKEFKLQEYNLNPSEELVEQISNYIKNKFPEERAKLERDLQHEESRKYEIKILENTEAIQVQNQKHHEETKTNLAEVFRAVNDTRDTNLILSCISDLKLKLEEVASTMKENIVKHLEATREKDKANREGEEVVLVQCTKFEDQINFIAKRENVNIPKIHKKQIESLETTDTKPKELLKEFRKTIEETKDDDQVAQFICSEVNNMSKIIDDNQQERQLEIQKIITTLKSNKNELNQKLRKEEQGILTEWIEGISTGFKNLRLEKTEWKDYFKDLRFEEELNELEFKGLRLEKSDDSNLFSNFRF